MGFVREGNRKSAEIGREMALVRWFVKYGYVVEIYDDVLDASYQVPGDSAYLDNQDDEALTRITDRENIELEHLDFDREVRQMGLHPEGVPLTRPDN